MSVVELAITNECLGGCMYCPYGATSGRNTVEPNLLLATIETLDPKTVSLVRLAGGDTFSAPYTLPVVELLIKKAIPFELYTPVVFDGPNLNELMGSIQAGKGCVVMPLWSAMRKEQNYLGGWPLEDARLAAEDMILGGVPFKIVIYLTALNYMNIQGTVELAIGWGAQSVIIKRALPGLGVRWMWPLIPSYYPQPIAPKEKIERHLCAWGEVCNIAPKEFYVTPEGNVCPCVLLQHIQLGNVQEYSLGTIINKRQDWKLKETVEECGNCEEFLKGCSGSCPAASVIFSSKVKATRPDPLCSKHATSSIELMSEALFWEKEEKNDEC